MKSQNLEILNYLKEGNPISPLEALEKFGSMRLGARIKDLRNLGHNIVTKMVGDKKRYAQYFLEKPPMTEVEKYEVFG